MKNSDRRIFVKVLPAAALLLMTCGSLSAGNAGYGAYPGYGAPPGYGRPVPPGQGYGMPGRPMMPPGYGQQTRSSPQQPDSSAEAGGAGSYANEVSISGMRFQSGEIRVKAGETVIWENRDGMPHTVTSRSDGELASNRLGRGSAFKHTFDKPGTYEYFCKVHPSMTGKVIVE